MSQHANMPEIRRAPQNMRWPGDRNVAVVFNVAYEVWSEGAVSAIGPMGNPMRGDIFDANADTYGRYGAATGIRRLMGVLAHAGITGNVFTSGVLAERDPDQVRAVAKAGHEIVTHGYAQDLIPASLSAEQDEDYMRRATQGLASVTGTHPSGWISPRATASVDTMRRLVRHGYKWQGDSLDTDLPYLQKFEEGDLVAVPLSIEVNDLAHSMRFGRTPRQFVELFDDALSHMLANTKDVVILDVLVHSHCYGRPAGAWAYAEIAEKCAGRKDIWITTRGKIADHFLSQI
ncbi:MAG: polysaccharide deacetylase family protein [Acetobacteraceae bacterium]|nr:polysaccharide deacetylase family protein [Acetobacteraceae bacterium]